MRRGSVGTVHHEDETGQGVTGERIPAEGRVPASRLTRLGDTPDVRAGRHERAGSLSGDHGFDAALIIIGQLEAFTGEDLDAVVLERVVGRGDDDPGRRARVRHIKGHARSRQDPHSQGRPSRGAYTRAESRLQHRATDAGIPADDDQRMLIALFPAQPDHGPADRHSRLGRHGGPVGHAANAIGAEQGDRHYCPPAGAEPAEAGMKDTTESTTA